MSVEIPTWDKIGGAVNSTTSEFGGNWANLISDYFNGVNIALIDASKTPILGALTRFKFEKLGLFDTDQSHSIVFSVDDIDTGTNRKIRIRRMNTPFEEDFMALEKMGQTFLNKTLDFSLNTATNLPNSALIQITDKAKLPTTTAYEDDANIFTLLQTIQANIDPSITLYKTTNSGNIGIDFDAQSSTSVRRNYGAIDTAITANTNTTEQSSMVFRLMNAGTLGNKMQLNGDGNLGIGHTFKGYFNPNSVTTSDKVYTLPNLTGNVVLHNTTDTFTNKTLLDTVGTNNQIGVHIPYTFTIYQNATQYVVRNNWTGVLQTFSNADFAPALAWAIDNLVTVGLGTQDSLMGGSIFIQRGVYTATTNIAVDIDTATRHGITVEGEGEGTLIYFNPPSGTPLTDGITIDMVGFKLRKMRIKANQYVTNIIRQTGHNSGRRNDYNKFEYLMVEGPNGDAGFGSKIPISGQVGLKIDGTNVATFFGQVLGCEFIGLEIGLYLYAQYATSTRCIANVFQGCEYGIVEEGPGQNIINGIWYQGSTTVGTTGIWIKGPGQNTIIDNVVTEVMRENPPGTAVACRSILLDSGVQNIKIGQVNNVFDGIHALAKTIEDNSGNLTNSHSRNLNVKSKNFIKFDDVNDQITFNTSRTCLFGNQHIYISDSNAARNYILKGGAIGTAGSKTVTIPSISANSNFVLDDTTQTLTNKTLTTPTIASILNTGTLTLPTSTDTLVGRATTDTLTNKTLTTPTLTTPTVNGVKFALPAAKTADYTATTTDYYIPVTCSTVNITVNLPAVTGNAGLTYIIYKTDATAFTVIVDGSGSETINGATTFSLLKRYQHIRLECTGSEWIATRDTRITDDTVNNLLNFDSSTVVFTNQQIRINDTPVLRNYLIKGGTITTAGTKTIEIPDVAANDKFILETTTQTLTNKTVGNIKETWVDKSSAYTMTDADYGITLSGTGTYNVTLPAVATRAGKIFQFKKTGASGVVTLVTNASETIDGVTTKALSTQWDKLKILCTGTEWLIISN